MAERRMFAKSVAWADKFVSLPVETRLTYFYLCLSADDDGFVDWVQSVAWMAKGKIADIKRLEKKGYLYCFSSGAVVIRHWLVHNLIKKDRYHPTCYAEEKAMLLVNEKKVYEKRNPNGTQMEPEWNPNGTKMEPEDRLGKDRLGKDRSGEGNDAPAAAPPSFEKEMLLIQEQYNRICTALPRCMRLSEARKKSLAKALAAGRTVEDFVAVFGKAQASAFLKGGNARGWAADFDWLIREQNMDKVLEGTYDDRPAVPKGASGTLGQAELEAIQRVLQEK